MVDEAVATDGPAVDRELGVAYDLDLIFDSYNDGAVWDMEPPTAAQINEALVRDGRASGLELALTLPNRRASWSLKPPKGDTGQTEWLTEFLTRSPLAGGMSTPIRLVIAQMLNACVVRRSYHEKVFKVDNGKWVYDKLAWRPPATCKIRIDPKNGAFRGFQQEAIRQDGSDTEPIRIDPPYALVHINGKHRNPILGHSDLEVAYWCYETKKKIRFLWYQFLEGQILPKTIVKAADAGTATAQAKRVATLRSAGVLGVPKEIDVDALDTSGKENGSSYLSAMRWLESEAAGSVLAGWMDLTSSASEGRGSYALSSDQSDFYLMSRTGVSVELAETITAHMIADLVFWNWGPKAPVPTFEFGPLSKMDAQVAVNLLSSLAVATDLHVPFAFIEELTLLVATYLGVPVDKIAKAMSAQTVLEEKKARNAAEAKVAQVAAPVSVAARLVKRGGGPNGRPPASTLRSA